jgi:hypothetical protein
MLPGAPISEILNRVGTEFDIVGVYNNGVAKFLYEEKN